MKDEDGYLYIMARTDDVINVAGHRLSTGGMEEVLAEHPDVAECAVIGVADQLKGQMPLGFLCLNAGTDRPHEEIVSEVVKLVREKIGPVAAFKMATVVDRLPKTRSGKILRHDGVNADGKEWKCRRPLMIRLFSMRSPKPCNPSATPNSHGTARGATLPTANRGARF